MSSTTQTAIELLSRLVAFDTTSHKPNRDAIDFIADYLSGHAIASEITPTDDGAKASLFATVGPPDTPGVGLSAHIDVVPVVGQAWDTDPFTLAERDGRLYGRGTSDMKGFLACVLAAVPELTRRPLKTPVHVVVSYDEEIGCLGVRPMIARMGDAMVRPRLVVVGEPTSMQVVDAHKGPVRWQIEVTGRPAHSSMAHLGVNAIGYAGHMLAELAAIESELARSAPDPRFEPPVSTLQVTEIAGGTAANIVPPSARIGFEVRALPGLDVAGLERRIASLAARLSHEMQKTAPETGIVVRRTNAVPPFAAGPNSDAVALALLLAERNTTAAVSYATEAGLFQEAGSDTVICGPGSIAQAHTANEWIAVSEIERCLRFIDRLGAWAES